MVFTYNDLFLAWKETVTQSSEENNRARYKYYLEDNLYALLDGINKGLFQPKPMRNKTVYFPKKRIVQVPTLDDKIVQHTICDNYVYNTVTKPLIRETSACLIGRGDGYASKILHEHLHKFYIKHGKDFYVLKCDIHHYFASIPHERLYKIMDRYIKDSLIKSIMIKYFNMMPVGIALGLQQSQLMANLFLSEMDHRIKEVLRAEYYCRHMDDFYIISDDVGYLNMCLNYIENYLLEIGLELNPKTTIFHRKFSFLGFSYTLTETGKVIERLDKGKRNSKHRQLKKMVKQVGEKKITIDKFAASYQGWRAHALEGDCKKLVRAWDSWLRSELNKIGYELIIHERSVKGICLTEHSMIST